MPSQSTVSALNQAFYQKMIGSAAMTAAGVATDTALLDPVSHLALPAIYNEFKVNTPEIFPQVCFVIKDGVSINPFRGTVAQPCRIRRYFADIEVWSRSQRQDSQDAIHQVLLGLFDMVPLDINQFDPSSYCYDCHEAGETPAVWRSAQKAYRATYRYVMTAGRGFQFQ